MTKLLNEDNSKQVIWYLVYMHMILQGLDTFSTIAVFKFIPDSWEMNPLLGWLMHIFGVIPGLLLGKIAAVIFIVLITMFILDEKLDMLTCKLYATSLVIANIIYFAVVARSFLNLF